MKIAILGSGAMGMLFGGYLSRKNEVTLIDVDKDKVDAINKSGVTIQEKDGTQFAARPRAALDSRGMQADLIILFVKAMFSRAALENNRGLIGPDTCIMTLQNGSGHDELLRDFVPPERIVIGTTQHNSVAVSQCAIYHGGNGKTMIGMLSGDSPALRAIAETFNACGFDTAISADIRRMIWSKLFINVSASVLSGILQSRLGFLSENEYGWRLACQLLREAVAVANAEGMDFAEDEVIAQVGESLKEMPDGYASIYADLRDGRKTEVDTISGSVVRAGRRSGTPTPCHEFVVNLVHALEEVCK